jgi:hypothetical protein
LLRITNSLTVSHSYATWMWDLLAELWHGTASRCTLICHLIGSIEWSPWEASSRSDSQSPSHTVHYRVHKSPQLIPILARWNLNPVQTLKPNFHKLHLNITLTATLKSDPDFVSFLVSAAYCARLDFMAAINPLKIELLFK